MMEEEKNDVPRFFKRLILPNKKPKPGQNSRNLRIGSFAYFFKDYLSGEMKFAYRCVNRIPVCKCCLHIPISNYDNNFELINPSEITGAIYINNHSTQCMEKNARKIDIEHNIIEGEALSSDHKVLEEFLKNNPLLEPKNVRVEMLKRGQKFKKVDILKKIQEIRNELFPKEDQKVFTPLFCTVLDSNNPNYNMFKAHIKIPYIAKEKGKSDLQEIVLFASHPIIKQMSASNQWFMDSTFKIASKRFKQILNILVFIPHLKIFYPVCHVFMSRKTEDLY